MTKEMKNRNVFALAGTAALIAVAVNIVAVAISSRRAKTKKKELPGSDVRVDLSASDITKLSEKIILKWNAVYDAVASVPLDKVSFQNVILPIACLEAQQFSLVQSCIFQKLVSTSEEIRQASLAAERRIDACKLHCSQREDVYRAVRAFSFKKDSIKPDEKLYVDCLVRDYERNGLHLTTKKREEAWRLKDKITETSLEFIKNLNDDGNYIIINEDDLTGLPPEFVKNLDKVGSGKLKLILRSEYVTPILELCKSGTTRRNVAMAYGERCLYLNHPLLDTLVRSRHKLARLLGYSKYADYVAAGRMARTSAKIVEFLEDLSSRLALTSSRDLAVLRDMKAREEGGGGGAAFGIEDVPYFTRRIQEEELPTHSGSVIRNYFPLSLVLSGIFKILEDVFGLRLCEITEAQVWHGDVRVFSVVESGSNETIGYLYLDLYSREGKYGQTCVVSLQNATKRSAAAVALLVSQLKKEDDRPTLLWFEEVVSLFHEFGHLVHHVCNRSASFVRFSGLCVDADFVEIPALVMENMCYDVDVMKLVSGFHEDITRSMDEETCRSLGRRRYLCRSMGLQQEIVHCLVDQIIHSEETVDVVRLYGVLHPEVMLGLPALGGTSPASSFPRCAVGWEASCYSRLWSRVMAADVFVSRLQGSRLFTTRAGLEYRDKLLSRAGGDPAALLKDFLGREPSAQPFLDNIYAP